MEPQSENAQINLEATINKVVQAKVKKRRFDLSASPSTLI